MCRNIQVNYYLLTLNVLLKSKLDSWRIFINIRTYIRFWEIQILCNPDSEKSRFWIVQNLIFRSCWYKTYFKWDIIQLKNVMLIDKISKGIASCQHHQGHIVHTTFSNNPCAFVRATAGYDMVFSIEEWNSNCYS